MLTRTFLIQFILLICLACVHAFATYFYWYWTIPQFDIFSHFLGGLWIAFFVLWIVSDVMHHTERTKRFWVLVCITTLYLGLGWEVFEALIGMTGSSSSDLLDSLKDLLVDYLGATVGMYIISRYI